LVLITALTPYMDRDSKPATPEPGVVLPTIVVSLQLVNVRAYSPMLPIVPEQFAPSFVPTTTTMSPPTVLSAVRLDVVTVTWDTNGGVVSAMAGKVYATNPLLCPARDTDTLYVMPRLTLVLHLAVVCRTWHGTHGSEYDPLVMVTFSSANESPKFWPWNWKIASLLMSLMAAKQLSVACTAAGSSVGSYKSTVDTDGGDTDTVTPLDDCPPTITTTANDTSPVGLSTRNCSDLWGTTRFTGVDTPFTSSEICSGDAPKLVPFRTTVAPLVGIDPGVADVIAGARYANTSEDMPDAWYITVT